MDEDRIVERGFKRVDGTLQRMDGTLERMDGTLERMDGTLARVDGTLERMDGTLERLNERFDRSEDRYAALFADFREFTRTMMLRSERAERDHLKALASLTAEITDNRAETRAQTHAILRLLDRFGPGDAPAPAGA